MNRIDTRANLRALAPASAPHRCCQRPRCADRRGAARSPAPSRAPASAAGGRARHRPRVRPRRRADAARRRPRSCATLVAGGGRLIDTASTYGDAESVLGDVDGAGRAARQGLRRHQARGAGRGGTEALARAAADARRSTCCSFTTSRDPQQSLAQFRAWKAQGLCRYIGITSTSHGDFAALEAVLAAREAGFRADRLFARRPRGGEARSCRWPPRSKAGGADRPAVRPRPPVPRRARQGDSRLGAGVRRRELGAVLPQIPARRPAGHAGHSRHRQRRRTWRTISAPMRGRLPDAASASGWSSSCSRFERLRKRRASGAPLFLVPGQDECRKTGRPHSCPSGMRTLSSSRPRWT